MEKAMRIQPTLSTVFCGASILLAAAAATAEPGHFLWANANDAFATTNVNWDAPGLWLNLDNGDPRTQPGVAGDILEVPYSGDPWTLQLTNDVTFGSLYVGTDLKFWGTMEISNGEPWGAPVTLTLDAGESGESVIDTYCSPRVFRLGSFYVHNSHDNLLLHLASPLKIVMASWQSANRVFTLNAPISGGTEFNPVPITFTHRTGGWPVEQKAFFGHTNTFRGNITVEQPAPQLPISLTLGIANTQTGHGLFPADDRMFGDTANTVTLRGGAALRFHTPNDDFVLKRTVFGDGKIEAMAIVGLEGNPYYEFYYNYEDEGYFAHSPRTLRLGEDAILSPGEADEVGTLVLSGTDLECAPGTELRVKIQPDGVCDQFVFDIPGDINLNGVYVNIDDSAATRKPEAAWAFAVADIPGAVLHGNMRTTSGYAVRNDIDSESGAETLVIYRLPNIYLILK